MLVMLCRIIYLMSLSIFIGKLNGKIVLSLDEECCEGGALIDILSDDTFEIGDDLEFKSQVKILYECINKLPDPQKSILFLRCENKTFKQIAAILNTSEGQVSQNYQKGLNMLRARYRGKLR